jgi:uncharacterized membrane protein
MRGIGTVIFVAFVSIILFGVVAPAVVEPVAQVFVEQMPSGSGIDANTYADRMLTSVLVWAPLLTLGVGIASAVVYYFRREQRATRRVR